MARKKPEKKNLCKCGCNQLVHKDYARGHIHRVTKAMYTEEWKEKVSKVSKENNPFKGKHHTEETKEKIRKSRSSRKWSDAERKAYEDNVEKRRIEKESQRTMCACGCGELAEYGNKYIQYHHHRNRSEEVIKNMTEAHKGQSAWNKGKTSKTDPRIPAGDNHCKGMKGKKHSDNSKDKMSIAQAKRYGSDLTSWERAERDVYDLIRKDIKYKSWRKEVFVRDNFICQECGYDKGGILHAHHIKPFAEILSKHNIKTLGDAINTQELWDINNGVTLCKKCHKALHKQINTTQEELCQ